MLYSKMCMSNLQNFKKVLFISLIPIFLLFSSSCVFKNHRTNYFVSGSYFGLDAYHETVSCSLTITSIDKDSYSNSNGINVVFDSVTKSYFSLEFSIKIAEDESINYSFVNLSDRTRGGNTNVFYIDENNVLVRPHATNHGLAYLTNYYSIEIIDTNILPFDSFFNLFIEE